MLSRLVERVFHVGYGVELSCIGARVSGEGQYYVFDSWL